MFWATDNTIWWTPRFKCGCILINLRRQCDAIFLCSGGHHIDVAIICFWLIESSQRKISMPRQNRMLIHIIVYDISYICAGGFTSQFEK